MLRLRRETVPQAKAPCQACNTDSRQVWRVEAQEGQAFTILRCPSCGLAFARPASAQNIDYGHVYGKDFHEKSLCTESSPARLANERRVVAGTLSLLRGKLPLAPGKMLDVGCGDGAHLKLFHDAGWEVHGTEASPYAVDYSRQRYNFPVSMGDLRAISLEEQTFDYIQLRHVIEHIVDDPVGLLTRVRQLLKPGGVVRIDTPNIGYAANLVLIDHRLVCLKRRLLHQPPGEYLRTYGNLEPPEHMLWFTHRVLTTALRRAALYPLKVVVTYQGDPDHYPLKQPEHLRWVQRIYRLADRVGAFVGRGSVLVVYAEARAS